MRIIAIILFLASNAIFANFCKLDSIPSISIDENGNKVFVYLEKEKPVFYQNILFKDSWLGYLRSVVESKISTDQSYLLRRQKAIFNRNMTDIEDLNKLFDDMADRNIGKIAPINCLEALLYEIHLNEQGVFGETEFCAALYKMQILGEPYIKIILSSGPRASGPDMTAELQKENRPVWAFIHNHFFALNNPTGDLAGTLLPSGLAPPGGFLNPVSDLKFYRKIAQRHGLQQAWITNGFDTSHFDILDKNGDGNYWIY